MDFDVIRSGGKVWVWYEAYLSELGKKHSPDIDH